MIDCRCMLVCFSFSLSICVRVWVSRVLMLLRIGLSRFSIGFRFRYSSLLYVIVLVDGLIMLLLFWKLLSMFFLVVCR